MHMDCVSSHSTTKCAISRFLLFCSQNRGEENKGGEKEDECDIPPIKNYDSWQSLHLEKTRKIGVKSTIKISTGGTVTSLPNPR